MRSFYFILFLLLSITVSAQEILTGLYSNPVVREKSSYILKQTRQGEDTIPIPLPLYDDFSENGVFPSVERWIDREAFINTDYPVYPINLGVATLDAINDSGILYSNAIPGPSTFIADHLTSRFIRLDSISDPLPRELTPADSVYLSFYYQPQGRGLSLTTRDSLSLQFLLREAFDSITPTDTIHVPDQWQHIWATPGMSLDTFYYNGNQWFRRVMIPVTDEKFFTAKFRFRFYNHVSLASNSQPSWQSNADPWNIDQVYLNSGRSQADTVLPEIRFIERPPSMLSRYTSMPYKQYSDNPGGEMGDTIQVLVTNRDIVPHISVYRYTVTQPAGTFFKAYQTSEFSLPSYLQTNFGYNLRTPVNFVFPISPADSSLFLVTHTIKESTAGSTLGDTVETFQRFYNYYSYDDGTPEQGYGLKGAGGRLAYRFKLNVSPDTLRAVSIYFNRTLTSASQQYFYLTVWNDNNNKPGDTLYSRFSKVFYTDSLNNFFTYILENPVPVTGTFYIGTEQTTDENLNIGFDSYNNAESEILFNVTGVWQNSVLGGALMMRPVIGKPLPVGIGNHGKDQKEKFTLYPNPNSGNVLNISGDIFNYTSVSDQWQIRISGMTGNLILEEPLKGTIDISRLSSGVYIVNFINRVSGEKSSSKLVITR